MHGWAAYTGAAGRVESGVLGIVTFWSTLASLVLETVSTMVRLGIAQISLALLLCRVPIKWNSMS